MTNNKTVVKNLVEADRLLTEAMGEEGIDDRLFGELADMVRKLRHLIPERKDDDAKARAAASYDTATRIQTLGEVHRAE